MARGAVIRRIALLSITAVSLYLLLPSLLEVFTSWRSLLDVEVGWVATALVFVAASFLATKRPTALHAVRMMHGSPAWGSMVV